MLLYHGTSADVARRALTEGLKTRKSHGKKSQWPKHPSNPNATYLTTAYALYFALNTLKNPKDGDLVGIVEVDTDKLYLLAPDEDVLEQVTRGKDDVKGDITERTRWYRKRLMQYVGEPNYKASLEAMGTCAKMGNIPPEAVTRVALIDPQKQPRLCWEALDPTITILNYQIIGNKYRELTERVFQGGEGITIFTP